MLDRDTGQLEVNSVAGVTWTRYEMAGNFIFTMPNRLLYHLTRLCVLRLCWRVGQRRSCLKAVALAVQSYR